MQGCVGSQSNVCLHVAHHAQQRKQLLHLAVAYSLWNKVAPVHGLLAQSGTVLVLGW